MSGTLADQVTDVLHGVIDPELGYNIVDLGLIYGVQEDGGQVSITMTMTTPGCPAQDYIVAGVLQCVNAVDGVEKTKVNVVWEPRWDPARMSPAAKTHFGIRGGA